MRWLVDGYNVIRCVPELAVHERESLQAGRQALCHLLAGVARVSGEQFTVVFDGAEAGGSTMGGPGVRVIFSPARETADDVLARMATGGCTVVSNDREVRRAADRAGAITVTTDEFLAHVRTPVDSAIPEKDEEDRAPSRPKKGNPRRLPKKARAAARALRRLGGTS